MTSGGPATSLLESVDTSGVYGSADHDVAPLDSLEMAFEAKIGIPHGEEFGVDRSVGAMAGGASFPHGFVFKDVGPVLGRVALQAEIILGQQGSAASEMSGSLVGRVTIGAGHLPFGQRVMIRQVEFAPHVGMTLKTHRFAGAGRRST